MAAADGSANAFPSRSEHGAPVFLIDDEAIGIQLLDHFLHPPRVAALTRARLVVDADQVADLLALHHRERKVDVLDGDVGVVRRGRGGAPCEQRGEGQHVGSWVGHGCLYSGATPRSAHAPSTSPLTATNASRSAANRAGGSFDIQLQVGLLTDQMRAAGQSDAQICRTSYRHAYWTVAQMVTHHTVNGCNLQPGDLFGSGTLSGSQPGSYASLMELSSGGKQPIKRFRLRRRPGIAVENHRRVGTQRIQLFTDQARDERHHRNCE